MNEKRVKIIATDNYARETVSDVLVASDVAESYAQELVGCLNAKSGPDGSKFFKIVPLDYKLFVYEP